MDSETTTVTFCDPDNRNKSAEYLYAKNSFTYPINFVAYLQFFITKNQNENVFHYHSEKCMSMMKSFRSREFNQRSRYWITETFSHEMLRIITRNQ